MKTLIITAHPSNDGFVKKMASQYAATKIAQGGEAQVVDIYDKEWKMDFRTFSEKTLEIEEDSENSENSENSETNEKEEISEISEKISEQTTIEKLQGKILWADEVVFAFPLWWGDAPAILKNVLDNVFTTGFAFALEKGKTMQTKLLTEKTAKVFITCDAPNIYYWFKGSPFKTIWKDLILGFCGIKTTDFQLFGSMRKQGETGRKKILEKVTKSALA